MTEYITILIVEDDPALSRALEINVRARGLNAMTTMSGAEALRIASNHHIDTIILDLGLPDMDGQEVIAGIRGWSDVPIIVLSARHTSDDRIDALDAGADDYITKPFDMGELFARLRAVRRRVPAPTEIPTFEAGDLRIDFTTHSATRAGTCIHLTPTEWRFLQVLVGGRGALVTQADILRKVWGAGYEKETHYLRVHVANLRNKLEADPAHPKLLLTEPGLGYRLLCPSD